MVERTVHINVAWQTELKQQRKQMLCLIVWITLDQRIGVITHQSCVEQWAVVQHVCSRMAADVDNQTSIF